MDAGRPPLPPPELALRVGVPDAARPLESFDRLGAEVREIILGLLPAGWTFEGKRVLDFGCGPGKVLRHFLREAELGELHGCDIDTASIAWLRERLSPPLHPFTCSEEPGLDRPEGFFDLVLAMSVFTHLTDAWAGWLAELHRVMRDGALLIATFLGRAAHELYADAPWDEERIGMLVEHPGRPWDEGGPNVFHSAWWLREHWGRAFEVLELCEGRAPGEHGVVLLRKGPGRPSAAELERIDPREEREAEALLHQARRLAGEVSALRAERDALVRRLERRSPRAAARRTARALRSRLRGP